MDYMARESLAPLLSIIIVSYRSKHDLERLLPSIYAQDFRDFEIVVVDNGPEDGTADWLRDNHPGVRLVVNPHNSGYSGGNNLGLEHAAAAWLFILNPDTELHSGALATLLKTAQTHHKALVNPKMLSPDQTTYACGNEMHYTGITTCLGQGTRPEGYQGVFEVPLVSGTGFLAPKEVFRELGGFDEDYFMYHEDTDFSLRARLAGYTLLCDAGAELTHHCTLGVNNPSKFYFLERNRLVTLFKIFETRTLVSMAPALLLTEMATWAFALLRGPRYLAARLRIYLWLWKQREALQTKRASVQQSRRASDDVLLERSLTGLPFHQLLKNPTLARLLDRLTRPLYVLAQPKCQ